MSQTNTDQLSEQETDETSEQEEAKEEKVESRTLEHKTELEPSTLDKQLDPTSAMQTVESSPPEELKDYMPSEQPTKHRSSEPEGNSMPLKQPVESQQELGTSLPENEPLTAYKPPEIPANRQFQAGVTYIGMDGYIYVQEIKQGKREVCINKLCAQNDIAVLCRYICAQ